MLWGLGVLAIAKELVDYGNCFCLRLLPMAIGNWLLFLVITFRHWLFIMVIDYFPWILVLVINSLWLLYTSFCQWLLAIPLGHWLLAMAIGYFRV